MCTSKPVFVVLFACFAAWSAFANTMDRLVDDIAGGDARARALARQLLPRHGVKAIPKLIPLLSHKDMAVSKTAFNTIEDLVNRAGAPERDQDRLFATGEIMKLLEPEQPESIKIAGMRLLPLIAHSDLSLEPLAGLLENESLREKARECLQHIGTENASDALLAAVPDADPAFARALVDAVGRIGCPSSVERLKRIASEHAASEVRAAALHALAWTGDPSLAVLFREVRSNADDATRLECERATIRLAENMGNKGGNWQHTIALFREILSETQFDIIKRAAMMGLGRFGDETVVAPILSAAEGGSVRVQATVVAALEQLRGPAPAKRIIAAYPKRDTATQLLMVQMFGRKSDPMYLPILKEAAASQYKAFRMAALNALSSSSSVDALPVLVTIAREGTDEERTLALEAASNVAGSLGTAGDAEAAGSAYWELFDLAEDPAIRRTALEGLARYPVAGAFDVIMASLADKPLAEAARAALPGLFGALVKNGEEEKALDVFNTVLKSGASPETVVNMVSRLQGLETSLDTTKLLGVVKQWHIIGPFQWKTEDDWETAFVGEPDINLESLYKDGDAERRWKNVTTDDALGMVNLMGEIGQHDRVFAYAYTEVDVPEATPAQIRLGSDDGNVVWLNGEKVWENRVDRGAAVDQDIVPCQLQQGENRILVKISQGAGGWNFMLRITKPDGTAPW
ncbi:MAG: HEAT repeat domain-containing protein [Candidatus Hydrogenedentota bacterium]